MAVVRVTYDHELTLISKAIVEDELGNQTEGEEVERNVLCGIKSVGRTEFYDAAVKGLKPELIFVINQFEYEGENKVKFENNLYSIIRTYSTGEELELTCERDIGNG